MYTHMYLYACIYLYVSNMHIHIFVCMCILMYVSVCIYVCVYACIYACMYKWMNQCRQREAPLPVAVQEEAVSAMNPKYATEGRYEPGTQTPTGQWKHNTDSVAKKP